MQQLTASDLGRSQSLGLTHALSQRFAVATVPMTPCTVWTSIINADSSGYERSAPRRLFAAFTIGAGLRRIDLTVAAAPLTAA